MSNACRASLRTEASLPAITPLVACCISKKPPRTKTKTDAPKTEAITRNGSDRHHQSMPKRHHARLLAKPFNEGVDPDRADIQTCLTQNVHR